MNNAPPIISPQEWNAAPAVPFSPPPVSERT